MLAVFKDVPEQLLSEIVNGVAPAVAPAAPSVVDETVGSVTVASLLPPSTEIVQVVSVICPLIVIVPSTANAEAVNAEVITIANADNA